MVYQGCGQNFDSKNQLGKTSKKNPDIITPPPHDDNSENIDLPPPQDDNNQNEKNDEANQPPVLPPPNVQIIKACYYSPINTNETCYNVIEATDEQVKSEYSYKDPFTNNLFPGNFNPNQYIAPKRFIPLNEVDGNSILTSHFKINELMQLHKGDLALFSPDVLFHIEKMRDSIKKAIHIHSGYRSPAYNESLSGTANWSRHMYGDAIDFHIEGESFENIAKMCLDHGASFYQIYQAHIHCDWRNVPLNGAFYEASNQAGVFLNYKIQSEIASNIVINEDDKNWSLSINSPAIEDSEDQLMYIWEVSVGKKSKIYKTPTISLKKDKKSVYQIKVTVGGSMELYTQLHMP